MSNLLDKASIILTPTAYNNGEALCVKPSDGSGDFDFSRNSAATRVNAQGLVENVQILSSNLVQNGDFSEEGAEEVSNGSFSQEGAEQITNGSFDTDSYWTKGTGWSISGGSANCDGTQSGNSDLRQQNGIKGAIIDFVVGKTYKVNFDIVVTSGNITYIEVASGYDSNAITTSGNHTTYITAVSTNDRFTIAANPDFTGSIDNVSVREVGQDWTLGTGWSIGEDKAICDGTNSPIDQYSVTTIGKTYKVDITVADMTTASINIRLGTSSSDIIGSISANGTYTFYGTVASNTTFRIRSSDGFDGSVTNISVKEVGQNWIIGSDWSIAENKAVSSGSGNNLQQTINILSNKTYKLTFDVISTSGTLAFDLGGATAKTLTDSGSKEYYFQSVNTNNLRFYGSNYYGSITNISIIEITDDTNLPRINYEGFSYQDALGSELVTNGGFDTDSDWSKIGNVSISGGSANFIDNGSNLYSYIRQNISQINGKKYLIDFEIKNYSFGVLQVILQSSGIANTYNSNGKYSIVVESSVSNGYVEFSRNFDGGTFSFSIDNVSVKEYLGQEVVPGSGCGSWLWEPQTTQLLPYSEDFSQYSTGSSPIITGGFLAPDGTNNAYKITNSGSSTVYLSGVPNLSSTSTRSIYARSVSGTGTATLMSYFGNTNNVFTLTEQWQRFEVAESTTTVGESNFYAVDFRGSGTLSEIILWGANATNDQDYATSYIPSNGTTVTRNQDVCTNGGSLASINSTEGVLYAEIAALVDSTTPIYISLSDGTVNNRVSILLQDIRVRPFIRVGNVEQAGFSVSLGDNSIYHKIAFKYKENDFALWVNGVELGSDASGLTYSPNTLNKLSFDNGGGGSLFQGKTKCLAVFPYLTDSELQSLTTI